MKRSDDSRGLFDAIGKLLADGCPDDALYKELDHAFGEICATLVLDTTGFTRVSRYHDIAYFLSLIYRLRRVGRDIFRSHHAIDWRGHADNLFAEFSSVSDAVQAAFSIHQYFKTHSICMTDADDPFGVCIGIGYGRVLRSLNEGVYGNEMNLAAKLGEDVAAHGETLLTENAFNALPDHVPVKVEKRREKASGVEIAVYSIYPASP